MSVPGSLTETDKTHIQIIPAVGPIDGGTFVRVRGDDSDFDTQRTLGGKTIQGVYFPIGDATFTLQGQCKLGSSVLARATWIQVELCRTKLVGGTVVYDTTGKQRFSIVQPGTSTFPFTHSVPEFVNEDDGAFGWTITAGNREDDNVSVADLEFTFFKYKYTNQDALDIHHKHGWNMMSNGVVSDLPWL